jgi:phytanoyl-CoA hydroxylase
MLSQVDSPAAIRSFFEENGYYIAKGVYSPVEVADLERDFDRIVHRITESSDDTNARWGGPEMEKMGAKQMVVTHTHQVQNFSATWAKAFHHEKFLGVAEAILGPDIVLHHSKLFQKPAENGAPFPMHQDWDYFPTLKDSMIAGIIHVSRATDEMGCLRIYPGTHKLGRLDQSNGTHEGLIFTDYPIENSTPVELEPGDVVFFHYFLIHGSMPNRSNETRKTVLVQMHSGDDKLEDWVKHPYAKTVLRGFNHHQTRHDAAVD